MTNVGKNRFIPLAHIAERMLAEGLSQEFVYAPFPLAMKYEGVFELMVMWSEESDRDLKSDIIADLQEEVDEKRKSDPSDDVFT